MSTTALAFDTEEPSGSFNDLFEDWLDDDAVDVLYAFAQGELDRLLFRAATMPLSVVARAPGCPNFGADDDSVDLALVDALAAAYRDGCEVPPPIVSETKGRVAVLDGTHRLDGAAIAGRARVSVWCVQLLEHR